MSLVWVLHQTKQLFVCIFHIGYMGTEDDQPSRVPQEAVMDEKIPQNEVDWDWWYSKENNGRVAHIDHENLAMCYASQMNYYGGKIARIGLRIA